MKKILLGMLGALVVGNVGMGLFTVGRYLLNQPSTIAIVLGFNLFAITISGGILIADAIMRMHSQPQGGKKK